MTATTTGRGVRVGRPVGFGVIGARSMVATRAVLPAIDRAEVAVLAAAAARGGPVPEPWSDRTVASYDDVLAHPGVDALYVPLPNGMHLEWVRAAADVGTPVLCEKPLGRDRAEAYRMADIADRAGLLLAEAWMTPFDPRWARALDLARGGLIGDVTAIDASFTFTIPDSAAGNYRWDPTQGGGALLDVGIYCLGAPVELWGPSPDRLDVSIELSPTGVDETTAATLHWPGDRSARIRCSFVEPEQQRLEYVGTAGRLVLESVAFTGGAAATTIDHVDASGVRHRIEVAAGDPYQRMIERFAGAVRGEEEWPRPVGRSIEMLDLLDRIREKAAR